MKLATILFFALLVGIPTQSFAYIASWFRLSESDSESGVNESEPFTGEKTLYLWVSPSFYSQSFAFQFTSSLEIVELVPLNGFFNEGSVLAPLLTREDICIEDMYDGEVAARLVVSDASGEGGVICFERTSDTNRLCGTDCDSGTWFWFEAQGYSSDGSDPCFVSGMGSDCESPLPVDAATWGKTKALYR